MTTASFKPQPRCSVTKYKITVKCNSSTNDTKNCMAVHRYADFTAIHTRPTCHAFRRNIAGKGFYLPRKIRLRSTQQQFGSCRVDLLRPEQFQRFDLLVFGFLPGRATLMQTLSSLYQHDSGAAAGASSSRHTSMDCCLHSIPWKAARSRSGWSIGTGGWLPLPPCLPPWLRSLSLSWLLQYKDCSVLPAQHSD